jgi:hypothetical protein
MNTSPKEITAQQLMDQLNEVSKMKIDDWLVSLCRDGIWLTNPYGLDCGLYDNSTEECSNILTQTFTQKNGGCYEP